MKILFVLLALLCTPLAASFTLTVEGGTPVSPPGGLPYLQLPDATNGVSWTSGVTMKCTNISPPLGNGSSYPYSVLNIPTNSSLPPWNGLTYTRQNISNTEVWFHIGGIPNDVPGAWQFYLTAVQIRRDSPTLSYDVSEAERCGNTLLAGAGGGGDPSDDGGGSDSAGCSTGVGQSHAAIGFLALLALLLLRLGINSSTDFQLNSNGVHIDADRDLTEDEIKEWKLKLSAMSQEDLAELQRFAPSGHPVFDTKYSLHEHFKQCFRGMTPGISKTLGWDSDSRFPRNA